MIGKICYNFRRCIMDWLRDTIYPPTESSTWTDTLQNVLKTSAESLLTFRDVIMELIKVYLVPVFHLIVEQIKTIFQILLDNFYRHLLPFLTYLLGQIRTFAVYLFDVTASLCQNFLTTASDVVQFLKYHSTVVLANWPNFFGSDSWRGFCTLTTISPCFLRTSCI